MMKNKIVFLVLICFLLAVLALSGCSHNNQSDYGDQYIHGMDAQCFSHIHNVTASDKGFYSFYSQDFDDDILKFMDKKTRKMIPVCSKPNCNHNDNTCDAYYRSVLSLTLYNDKIYIVAGGTKEYSVSLYKANMDGSGKEEIKTLYMRNGDASLEFEFIIHRGYVYYVANQIEQKRKESTQILYRTSLDSSDEKEELLAITGYSPLIYISAIRGNRMCLYSRWYEDKDMTINKEQNYEMDIRSNQCGKLDLPGNCEIGYCDEDKIICSMECRDEEERESSIDIFSRDGKRLSSTKCLISSEIGYDEKYIYRNDCDEEVVKENRVIKVFSHDGKQVSEIKNPKGYRLLWSDSTDLFLQKRNEDDSFSYSILSIDELLNLEELD